MGDFNYDPNRRDPFAAPPAMPGMGGPAQAPLSPFPFDPRFYTDPTGVGGQFNEAQVPFPFGGFNYSPQPPMQGVQTQFDPIQAPAGMGGMDFGGGYPMGTDDGMGGAAVGGFPQQGQGPKTPTLIPELHEHDNLPEDGGPDDHPGFLDFMREQNPWGDVGIKAAILARSFTNPEQAIQWAIRLKENETQRQFQAMQHKATQDAITERTKQGKKETQDRAMYYKIDAARKDLANAGIDPGELPNDPTQWPSYYEDLRPKLAEAKKAEKDKKDAAAKEKKDIAAALKTGFVGPDNDNNPMVQAAAKAYQVREDRSNARLDIAKKRESRIAEMPVNTPEGKLRQSRAKKLDTDIKELEKDINRKEQNIFTLENQMLVFPEEGTGAAAAMRDRYLKLIENYEKDIDLIEGKKNTLTDRLEGLLNGEDMPEDSDSGRSVKTEPKPGEGGGPSTNPTPTEAQSNSYLRQLGEGRIPKAKLDAAWQKRFPGVPTPVGN